MRTLVSILLLLTTLPTLGQFGQGVAAGRWEPRNYKTKLGLVADYNFGKASCVTLNGWGISRVCDGVGSTNALLQATALNQPTYDITNTLSGYATAAFNGTSHFLKSGAIASLVQPETVVWCGKQITWTANDYFYDGDTTGSRMILAQSGTTPTIAINGGSADVAANTNLTVGVYGTVSSVFNGASSSLQVNKTTPTTGSGGTTGAQGFTLGSRFNGAASGQLANAQVARVLLSNKVLTTNELEYLRFGPLKMVGAK